MPTVCNIPEAVALTDSSANEQLLYFTTQSLTSDDAKFAVITDRFERGGANLAWVDRESGEIHPLTHYSTPPAACYPYFDTLDKGHQETRIGRNRKVIENGPVASVGLNKSSPSLHAETGDLYYVYVRRDGWSEVKCDNLHTGSSRSLAEITPERTIGYTHISRDNRRLLLPAADARVLEIGARRRQNRDIAVYFEAHKLTTHFLEIDTQTHAVNVLWEDPEWVTHVQYHPFDTNRLLYNHEWRWPLGTERMWLRQVDEPESPIRLRPAGLPTGPGHLTSELDDVSHEIWQSSGEWVLYHGYGPEEGSYIGRVSPESGVIQEIWLPPEIPSGYGHFYPHPDGTRIVTDALGTPNRPDSLSEGISILTPNWTTRNVHCRPLCASGSSWRTQDDHPHPIISHSGSEVFFTSDKAGKRAVYSIPCS